MKRYLAFFASVALVLSLYPFEVSSRGLPPADFGNMYSLADSGDLGALLAATHRGLDLDATNDDGDTGICVAIKRGDYMAYNTFIKAGAMNHPPCVNNISKGRYKSFMSSSRAVKYSEYPTSFVPRESDDLKVVVTTALGILGLHWLISVAGN